jgi:hypothetical protein
MTQLTSDQRSMLLWLTENNISLTDLAQYSEGELTQLLYDIKENKAN